MGDTFILIIGDPVDGFTHIGPFTTREDAIEVGERLTGKTDLYVGDWWIIPLTSPDEVFG